MDFHCKDLPNEGLVLVPPSSPDYGPLLEDIRRRIQQPVEGGPSLPEQFRPRILEGDRPTSAILLNQSSKPIAALQCVWHINAVGGHSYLHSRGFLSSQTLLNLGALDETKRKVAGYWNTILPGSKRYLSRSGMAGDNSDVRPPEEGERLGDRRFRHGRRPHPQIGP